VKCADIRKLIDKYTDNALSSSERKGLDAHLSSCPSCAKEFAEARSIAKALRSMPVIKAPKGFESRLNRKLGRATRGSLASKIISLSIFVKIPLAAAAVIVVGLSIFLVPGFFPDHDTQTKFALAEKDVAKDQSARSGYFQEDREKPSAAKETTTGGRTGFKVYTDESGGDATSGRQPIDLRLAMNIDKTEDTFGTRIDTPAEKAITVDTVDKVKKADTVTTEESAKTAEKSKELDTTLADAQLAAKADTKIAGNAGEMEKRKERTRGTSPGTQELNQAQAPRRSLDDIVLSNGGQVISQKREKPTKEEERKSQRKAKAAKQKASNKQIAQRTYNVQIRLPAKQYKNFVKDLSGVGKVDAQTEKVPEKGSVDINLEVTE
jgi:hypothetical protein